MDEQKIREITRQEINSALSNSRYTTAAVQRHVHNNIDSPYTFQPILTYAGQISSAGTSRFLPLGWTVVRTGTGQYTMTHNLNTLLYVVIATTNNQATTVVVDAVPSLNSVAFYGIDVNTGGGSARADIGFMFALTVVNNRSQTLPSYSGSLVG